MNITEDDLRAAAHKLGDALTSAGLMLVCAESCTGGWVAKVITDIAGSSNWFDRGFVTYTNDAKQEMLGVSADTLLREGAVSEATAREMAAGALQHSHADYSLAISGIAGPGGGTPYKPVGTVCLAWASREGWLESRQAIYSGDRNQVRMQAVHVALQRVLEKVAGEE
ncbi:MAG: nicotinamide-nucleotide amidase [Gammaproteobacteria bacterium]